MTSQPSGAPGGSTRRRTARSRSASRPRRPAACARASSCAELEPDGEHRVREVADVDRRELAAADRLAQVGLELPQPGGQHRVAEALADRAEVAAQERERAGIGGDELEERAEAGLDERLRARAPSGGPRGRGAAPRRPSPPRSRGRPPPCRGSSCRTCRRPAPCAGRCRARRPRRSRARRRPRGRPRGSRRGWRPWCRSRLPIAARLAKTDAGVRFVRSRGCPPWIRSRRRSRRRAAWCGAAGPAGIEVAVAHRPHREDWSLPKGKLDPGESWEQAALREVEEEIGFRCRLGRELPPTSYTDQKGRSKVVRYWLMEPEEGEFAPNDEVDELRWLIPSAAAELLTYPHDRELVAGGSRVNRERFPGLADGWARLDGPGRHPDGRRRDRRDDRLDALRAHGQRGRRVPARARLRGASSRARARAVARLLGARAAGSPSGRA